MMAKITLTSPLVNDGKPYTFPDDMQNLSEEDKAFLESYNAVMEEFYQKRRQRLIREMTLGQRYEDGSPS